MSSVARDTGRDSVGKGKAPSRLDGPAARARAGADTRRLPGTAPLTLQGDLAAQMVAGIDRFLARQLKAVVGRRPGRWQRDVVSPAAYEMSVEANRRRLLKIIGLLDQREEVQMQLLATHRQPALVAEGPGYRVERVRWNVFRGIEGEGLLLEPSGPAVANIVALPDCDWTPEAACGLEPGVPADAQFPRRLAENGCRVVVPVLIDRHDTYSGIDGVRMTNLPHREFVYRAAYELGRHIIGYEVQKVLAAADWLLREYGRQPLGVFGYGEGGLVALFAAAVDRRIQAAGVSGYFGPRETLWRQPIYRNIWSLLVEFGDAEIASLIAPRSLVVEVCRHPEVAGPPAPSPGRVASAAPGIIDTPDVTAVEQEFERALRLVAGLHPAPDFRCVKSGDGRGLPGSGPALESFLRALGTARSLAPAEPAQSRMRSPTDGAARMKRQLSQLVDDTQHLMRESQYRRAEFWSRADESDPEAWRKSCAWYRAYMEEELLGRSPDAESAPNPRTRLVYETSRFTGYEVVLEVYPEVFAYGILLVPKGIRRGERRPVVVCQHGLEGRPQDTADPSIENNTYGQFACRLAERGFVTFAPQNPYIGEGKFRVLVRKSHPLKQSLYSVIVRQHECVLRWLAGLAFVDAARIAFYGLSYGGKTAMRIPALLEGYCLSICSADYNEWVWKNVSARHPCGYLTTGEYDMYEFDLANTFNYAEMSWLICPRPFMVERGHHDGVAPDEWVAYEYARTRRRYDLLGLGDRTEMEVFNGPHSIHGVDTFDFLHRHLNWPNR